MPNDQIKVDVKVTGQPAVNELEKSIESLKGQVKALDKQFDESTGGQAGYGKARANLTNQIREQEELLSKLKPGGGDGGGGDDVGIARRAAKDARIEAKEAEHRQEQAIKGAFALVASGAGVYAAGKRAVQYAAGDVANYQLGQLSSFAVDVKQDLGGMLRNWLFGKEGERTVQLETQREQTARRVKDLEERGVRNAQEQEELVDLRHRQQRLEAGYATFLGARGQPTVQQRAVGAALGEELQRTDIGKTSEILLQYEKDRITKANQPYLDALRDTQRMMQEQLNRTARGVVDQGADLQLAKRQKEMSETLAKIGEDARANVGLLMKRALEGDPAAMNAFIDMLKRAGMSVEQFVKNMERADNQAQRAERARQEEFVRQDQQQAAERNIQNRAAAMGVDKLLPLHRDLGTQTALAAAQAGVDAEHATKMGIRAIDDKFHQTIRALDDLESNIKARNAMAEMLPQMRQMAGRQAHVPIDARMIQNALEEATGAIAEGAFAAPAVFDAMNRQVIQMRANAREMRRFGHMFGQLMPQFPQNGGNF